jgi:nitrogen-specific signal transduction histidine kinase
MSEPGLDKENHSKGKQQANGLSPDTRNFGEVLRHELNNPLTGILGNAELLLVELRRNKIDLPEGMIARLETVASLAVRMRETVCKLSEEWEATGESADRKFQADS